MMYKSEGKKGTLKNKCVLTNSFLNQKAPKNYQGKYFSYNNYIRERERERMRERERERVWYFIFHLLIY
jgi:hypothetical protein